MKKYKLMFWIPAIIIFLFEGVLTALTFRMSFAQQGITGLGYPVYFGTILVMFKVLGGLALVIPQVNPRIKEWAFAGFGIDFICAFISIVVVTGFTPIALGPVIFMGLLVMAYVSYHKLNPGR